MKRVPYFLSLILFLFACSGGQNGRNHGLNVDAGTMPAKIIDAHVHIDFDEEDVSHYKVFTDNNYAAVIAHASREEVVPKKLPKLPFKVFACAGIDPEESPDVVEKGLQEKKVRCLKIYLGYVPKYPNDPAYMPYYKLAQKYKVPVVFHTGDTSDKAAHVKYADPLGVDEIAAEFHDVKFLLAHLGNPWFASAAEVIYKNDNVYADVSAMMLGDVSKTEPEVIDELVIKPLRWVQMYVENPKKLMFGTDYSLVEPGPYIELMKKAIPSKNWQNFFYQNAVDFFGLAADLDPSLRAKRSNPRTPKPGERPVIASEAKQTPATRVEQEEVGANPADSARAGI